jgi:hypothetical protein
MANRFPSASIDLVRRSNDQLMAGDKQPARQWSATLDQQCLNEMLKSAYTKITYRSKGSRRPCH